MRRGCGSGGRRCSDRSRYAALLWLAQQPWVDPSRVAIGGLSSGGGVAAALAFLARDRGEIQPAFNCYLNRTSTTAPASSRGRRRLVWSEGDNRQAWRWYLGDADPAVAVPARRTDLAGLAPAWIGSGSLDLLHDEAVERPDQSPCSRFGGQMSFCVFCGFRQEFGDFGEVGRRSGTAVFEVRRLMNEFNKGAVDYV